jgi:hypothetical protein
LGAESFGRTGVVTNVDDGGVVGGGATAAADESAGFTGVTAD